MVLLLFDIDGTLTETNRDDDRLFRQALEHVVGDAPSLEAGWEAFSDVTDSATARAVIAQAHGRPARDDEVFAVRRRFIELWEKGLLTGRVAVEAVPGAAEIVRDARTREGIVVAIATGGWGPTANMKLAAAGIKTSGMAVASSDDGASRQSILNTAAIFAAAERGVPGFSEMVVIGDAVWDGRAAREVGAGFVARNTDLREAVKLRAHGAAAVLPDFADTVRFWQAVDAARQRSRAMPRN